MPIKCKDPPRAESGCLTEGRVALLVAVFAVVPSILSIVEANIAGGEIADLKAQLETLRNELTTANSELSSLRVSAINLASIVAEQVNTVQTLNLTEISANVVVLEESVENFTATLSASQNVVQSLGNVGDRLTSLEEFTQASTYACLLEIKPIGTHGGSVSGATNQWRGRDINTVQAGHDLVHLDPTGQQFTLSEGNYSLRASSVYFRASFVATRIFDKTSNSVALTGTPTLAQNGDDSSAVLTTPVWSFISGLVSIPAGETRTFELQYTATVSSSFIPDAALGLSFDGLNAPGANIFAMIEIFRH